MLQHHPFVLAIGGFDPSAGAGIFADIKTIEQVGAYGVGSISCTTLQTEQHFYQLDWLPQAEVLKQVELLAREYPIQALKIGVLQHLEQLTALVAAARQYRPSLFVCWDPVLRASTGMDFFAQEKPNLAQLEAIDLITPNYQEIDFFRLAEESVADCCLRLSQHCAVLLKGGHHPSQPGVDSLYEQGSVQLLPPDGQLKIYDKHGSGCVLASAIAAYKARGFTLYEACLAAKKYTAQFLASNPTLLGYHHVH